jgi:hypothetical protein
MTTPTQTKITLRPAAMFGYKARIAGIERRTVADEAFTEWCGQCITNTEGRNVTFDLSYAMKDWLLGWDTAKAEQSRAKDEPHD